MTSEEFCSLENSKKYVRDLFKKQFVKPTLTSLLYLLNEFGHGNWSINHLGELYCCTSAEDNWSGESKRESYQLFLEGQAFDVDKQDSKTILRIANVLGLFSKYIELRDLEESQKASTRAQKARDYFYKHFNLPTDKPLYVEDLIKLLPGISIRGDGGSWVHNKCAITLVITRQVSLMTTTKRVTWNLTNREPFSEQSVDTQISLAGTVGYTEN